MKRQPSATDTSGNSSNQINREAELDAENRMLKDQLTAVQDELQAAKNAARKIEGMDNIYKILAANIPGTAITILDREERYLLAEGDFLLKMGYRKETMPGKKISEVITPENYKYYSGIIQRAFSGETILVERQTLSTYWSLMKVVPLRNSRDEIFAIMFVLIDVTPVKEAQFELVKLNEGLEAMIERRTGELKSANKQLESFSYSVSHDLRAPLRSISGYTQVLKEDFSKKLNDPDFDKVADVVIAGAKRMSNLIDDILRFSKLNRQEMVSSTIDMNNMATEVFAELRASEPTRNIEASFSPLPSTRGDSSMMRQVWTNLISNALKYSRQRDVCKLQIGYREGQGEGYYFISDNGAGFDMAYASKLFGVFQRLHKQSEFEGTGVGLSLVHTIIQRHGGKIWAEAELEKGATFYFTLPGVK